MKLSPVTIPFRALELLFSLGWVAIFLIVIAAPMLERVILLVIAAGIALLVLGGSIGYSLAYYRRFTYELTEETFELTWGVFGRRHREIPYHRIQNVDLSRNILQRLAGIAEVRIETAGGETTEVHLRYVSEGEALRLQEEISERKRADRTAQRAAGLMELDREEGGERLFAITPTELALLGMVSFDVRLLIVVVAAALFLDPRTLSELFLAVPALVLAPVAIIAIYLAGALISGIVAVTNYYDFTLVRLEAELRYRRGLLRQFSGSIPTTKIQSINIAENVLARQIGYATLLIETAGFSPGETSGSQTAVPLAARTRVFRLAQSIEPFDFPEFERPPKRARERYVVRYTLLVLGLTAIAYLVVAFDVFAFPWYATAGLVVLVPFAAHLKWRNLGYVLQDDHVITQAGFWTRRTYVVPYHRIQTLFQRQTIFQRRRNLATLRVDTAGSSALVGQDAVAIDVDADVASTLREEVHDRMQDELSVRHRQTPWLGEPRDWVLN